MNLGRNILELRKKKNVTQEEMAAELGVTAAAVSKWENGYTLPDLLMLCALADYFGVTTDELLGRNTKFKYAVLCVSSVELGQAIKDLAKQYGFVTKHIFSNYEEALETVKADKSITHMFISFDTPMNEEEKGDRPDGLYLIEVQTDDTERTLAGFELYFRNMPVYDSLILKQPMK